MLEASPICSSRIAKSGGLSLDSTALASVAVWQSRPSVTVILSDTTAAGAILA